MAPRKPQSWAKVRAAGIAANKVKNASATPQSAWTSLIQQNNEYAGRTRALIDRKEQDDLFGDGDDEEADDEGEKKKGKKGTPKLKPKKVTKPAKKRKASRLTVASTRSRSTRSTSKHTIVDGEEEEDNGEFWRPYGGLETSSHSSVPTSCLGLARLATWQYPSFRTSMEEVLVQFGAGAELETEEIEHGGESNTDVSARFSSEDQAAIIKEQIEGDHVNGRRLQVRFVAE